MSESRQAHGQTVAPPAPAGQPTWINQQPSFQVGPNGAVNLDQPPTYVAQVPTATFPPQPYVAQQPMVAQPYVPQPMMAQPLVAQPQPWGPQPVATQPTWGVPFMPQTNVGGAIPYFYLHRTSLFGEFLYVRPRNAEVAYAMPFTEDGPAGPVAVVDPGYDPNFRVGGNYAVSEGNSIAAQYTRIRSDTSSSVAAGEDMILLGLPVTLLDFPDPEFIFADTATADLDIELESIDLDFRGLLAGCECNNYAYAVNYLAGVEFATLDQTYSAAYNRLIDDDDITVLSNINSDINFDGIGMRIGLQGERFFPNSGLFVYGNGISTILFGEFDASFQQVVTATEEGDDPETVSSTFTSWSAGRVVPVVDLELGAGWLGMNRHLRLSAGYRVSAWFNVVKTDDWIAAVQSADFRGMDGTLTFDGAVGRVEWLF